MPIDLPPLPPVSAPRTSGAGPTRARRRTPRPRGAQPNYQTNPGSRNDWDDRPRSASGRATANASARSDAVGNRTESAGREVTDRDVYQPRNWSAAKRRDLQRRMAEAGLLDGEYAEGVWDGPTMDAYAEALTMARGNNTTVSSTLRDLSTAWFVDPETGERRQGARGGGLPALQPTQIFRREYTPPAYEAPDGASLAALTRQAIAQLLGRQPSADEISAVQGDLAQWYRQSYDNQVAADRQTFEAEQDARIAEQMATAGTDEYGREIPVQVLGGPADSGATAPTSVQEVDPEANLEQLLRQRYGSEIGRVAQSEATRRTAGIAAGAGSSAMSAIFGSADRGRV